MGVFGNAMRGANISSEVHETDEELVAAVTKLSSIVEMFISSYGDFVAEVRATPMDLAQRRMKDIPRISITVLYSNNVTVDRLHEAEDCLRSLVDGEFDEVKGGVSIEFRTSYKRHLPDLCLYSVFPYGEEAVITELCSEDVEKFIGNIYDVVVGMIVGNEFALSLTPMCIHQTPMNMFIHCGTPDKILAIDSAFKKYGLKSKQYADNLSYKDYDVIYVPVINKDRLPYNLPYAYLDFSYFNEQYFEEDSNTVQS